MYGKVTGAPDYPKQLWQLSIHETAGIATVIVSTLLIIGIAYSIWW